MLLSLLSFSIPYIGEIIGLFLNFLLLFFCVSKSSNITFFLIGSVSLICVISSLGIAFSISNVSSIFDVFPALFSNSFRLIGSLPSSKYCVNSFASYKSLLFCTNSSKLIIAFFSCCSS